MAHHYSLQRKELLLELTRTSDDDDDNDDDDDDDDSADDDNGCWTRLHYKAPAASITSPPAFQRW